MPFIVQVEGADEEGEYVSLFGPCWVDDEGDQDFLVVFEHGIDVVCDGGGSCMFGCFVVVGGEGLEPLFSFQLGRRLMRGLGWISLSWRCRLCQRTSC